LDILSRLPDSFQTYWFEKPVVFRIIIFAGLILIISLFFPSSKTLIYNYELGSITREEIVAKYNFPILKNDEELQNDINDAILNTPFLFERDRQTVENQLREIDILFKLVSEINKARVNHKDSQDMLFTYRYTDQFNKVQAKVAADSTSLSLLEIEFTQKYPFNGSAPNWSAFHDRTQLNGDLLDYQKFKETLQNICRNRWAEGILDINDEEIQSKQIAVVVNDIQDMFEPDDINDLDRAWLKARVEINNLYPEEDNYLKEIGYSIIVEFMKPNILFDKETTERRQQDAVSKVPRSKGIVLKNERIVDQNTRVTHEILQKLNSYSIAISEKEKLEGGIRIILPWIGRFILIFMILSVYFSFIITYRSSLFFDNRMLLLFSSMIALITVLSYLFVFVFGFSEYLIPITVAPMVITILFDARIATMASVTLTLLAAVLVGGKLDYALVSLVTCMASIYAVRKLRTRAQLFSAILYIVSSGCITLISLSLIKHTELSYLLYNCLFIIISGFLAPFLTYGLSALFEILFGVTSDLTLLELSDFNHPLLKRLSQEANGTFNHCVVVGNLAESCAAAVGANPLLCRVGAYYHDIGKLTRPEYYIENQFHIENKHDSLTPTLSARIIASHVKDGLKLAKEYRIPSVVADFIPMHHGTSRIDYFYQKALEQADGDPKSVNESDFRYPGPKPNTKETGILMICEAVEAAVRSIKKPDINNIEAMVDKIVEKRLKERQLDECPITMEDLANLKGDVKKGDGLLPVLRGIYHIRIEYPKENEPPKGA
tara:strand:+ start:6477 stop:8804 length:2328 start_codon:yes stop_codon:yes gene_type:complete